MTNANTTKTPLTNNPKIAEWLDIALTAYVDRASTAQDSSIRHDSRMQIEAIRRVREFFNSPLGAPPAGNLADRTIAFHAAMREVWENTPLLSYTGIRATDDAVEVFSTNSEYDDGPSPYLLALDEDTDEDTLAEALAVYRNWLRSYTNFFATLVERPEEIHEHERENYPFEANNRLSYAQLTQMGELFDHYGL